MSQDIHSANELSSEKAIIQDRLFRVLSAESALHVIPYLEENFWEMEVGEHQVFAGLLGLSAFRAALTSLVACQFQSDQIQFDIEDAIQFLFAWDHDPALTILQASLEAQTSKKPFLELEAILDNFEEFAPGVVNLLAGKRNDFLNDLDRELKLQDTLENLVPIEATPFDGFIEELSEKSGTPSAWGFWKEWFVSFYNEKPLNWELQRQIAEIPDEDWQLGPKHIAKRIEEIRARFELEQQFAKLKEENARLVEKSRFEIGANGGPELVEAKQVTQEIIWAPIEAIEAETKKEEPDTGIIRAAIEKLKQGLGWLLTKSAENSLTFGMGWYFSDPAKAKAAAQSIITASESWLQALLNLVG